MHVPGHDSTYYELLEIPPRASREEIQVAYNRARAAFAQNSLAVYSLFSADECRDLQQRIEEAYRTLMNEDARRRYDESIGLGAGPTHRAAFPSRPAPPGPPPRPTGSPLRVVPSPESGPRSEGAPVAERPRTETPRADAPGAGGPAAPSEAPRRPPPAEIASSAEPPRLGLAGEPPPEGARRLGPPEGAPSEGPRRFGPPEEPGPALTAIPEGAVVTGALLRKLRERRGISLRDISQTTKVSLAYLQYIEEENFQQLPVPAYLRGFLKAYAKCVGLDPERVSGEYIKLYALYHEIKAER